MTKDELAFLKEQQKKSWSLFTPIEIFTTIPAATLVKFSGIKAGDKVLDVGCGTGVVAITAARMGAIVSGMDLTPALLERAAENATLADVSVDLQEGDVEYLSYPDQSFDAVLSQFGHMFAPRPEVAIKEMLRVLKPGGILAFSTWPPELYVGRMFTLVAKYVPLPQGVTPPSIWGDPNFVKQQLGDTVKDLTFDQGVMQFTALSLAHYRKTLIDTIGPVRAMMQNANADQQVLKQFTDELTKLATPYYHKNYVQQHFLMTRAVKR